MEVYLAQPRGFCAGVRRALAIVAETLYKYGAPIYVRHEIVHNKHVIEDLKKQGVVFIDELCELTDYLRPVIFSAHGVSQEVYFQAKQMGIKIIDATCPLVQAVHTRVKKLEQSGCDIIVIGKPTHPEILGTIGQLQDAGKAHIVTMVEDAENLSFSADVKLGLVTQTTLAIDDTQEIMSVLTQKFPVLATLTKANICFATTNRQRAVQELVRHAPYILIIGSKNSSNSTHLREAALRYGAKKAWLIDDVSEIDWNALKTVSSLGITAGASAPDYLIDGLLKKLHQRYANLNIHDVITAKEDVMFK
ncbi:MAG: 4-hydroxy-3-methylbut-2-enyl diphosphate reductase [Alphaproteobacteria bacterium]|nr:4-hydroxy-3-methylbut-2-enyl diphosphate reductase [Alphaproteobacteria bacterium]